MIKRILGVALLIGMFAIPAQAGVMVTVGNRMLTEGFTTDTIDVLVEADPDTSLLGFDLTFMIMTGSSRQIQFDAMQTFPLLVGHPEYVFGLNGVPIGIVGSSGFDNLVSDLDTVGGVTLDGSYLLTRLEIVPGTGNLAPQVGDTFTVSLVAASFFDEFINPVLLVQSTPGTVTIVAANAAVPEPSSAAALMVIAGIGAWARRSQSRRRDCGIIGA